MCLIVIGNSNKQTRVSVVRTFVDDHLATGTRDINLGFIYCMAGQYSW